MIISEKKEGNDINTHMHYSHIPFAQMAWRTQRSRRNGQRRNQKMELERTMNKDNEIARRKYQMKIRNENDGNSIKIAWERRRDVTRRRRHQASRAVPNKRAAAHRRVPRLNRYGRYMKDIYEEKDNIVHMVALHLKKLRIAAKPLRKRAWYGRRSRKNTA